MHLSCCMAGVLRFHDVPIINEDICVHDHCFVSVKLSGASCPFGFFFVEFSDEFCAWLSITGNFFTFTLIIVGEDYFLLSDFTWSQISCKYYSWLDSIWKPYSLLCSRCLWIRDNLFTEVYLGVRKRSSAKYSWSDLFVVDENFTSVFVITLNHINSFNRSKSFSLYSVEVELYVFDPTTSKLVNSDPTSKTRSTEYD